MHLHEASPERAPSNTSSKKGRRIPSPQLGFTKTRPGAISCGRKPGVGRAVKSKMERLCTAPFTPEGCPPFRKDPEQGGLLASQAEDSFRAHRSVVAHAEPLASWRPHPPRFLPGVWNHCRWTRSLQTSQVRMVVSGQELLLHRLAHPWGPDVGVAMDISAGCDTRATSGRIGMDSRALVAAAASSN